MDERFKMHRLYSTRFAAIIVSILVGILFGYNFLVNHIIRWDLFSILIVMAVSKIIAMVYYRKTN